MAVKLDMSKAYDIVGWSFSEQMLSYLCFPPHFHSLLTNCVMSVNFQVLINGFPTKKFKPKRGLRQRDSLSPFLFVICTEELSTLLWKGAIDGSPRGMRIGNSSPEITHLFFTK